MRVGVNAPSPSAPMLPSTILPRSCAETVMPPSMCATTKLQSSYLRPSFAAWNSATAFWLRTCECETR